MDALRCLQTHPALYQLAHFPGFPAADLPRAAFLLEGHLAGLQKALKREEFVLNLQNARSIWLQLCCFQLS